MPAICEGRDVVLSAETGSGKTLSYLIPLLSLQQSAQDNSDKHPGYVDPCPLLPSP